MSHQTAPSNATGTADTHAVPRPRLGSLAALAAAPTLFMVGALIHPAESSDGAGQLEIVSSTSGRWAGAHLVLVAGAITMIFAVLVLSRLIGAAAPGWAQSGSVLGIIGTASLVGLFAMEGFGALALSGVGDRASAAASFEKLAEGSMSFALGGLLLNAGLIVLAVGLIRTHHAPVWSGVILVLGAAGFVAAALTEIEPLFYASQVAMTIGMVSIAVDAHAGLES